MAIKFNFNGKTIIEPGSYARIVGGTTQTPTTADFGKVMIIDTGSGSFWGGGSGINGELASKKNAIYEFTDVVDFKKFVQGGVLWDLADFLSNPSNNGGGVSAIQIVRAATTTAATISLTFSGSGNIPKTGTITTSNAATAVTGVGTKFLTELRVGDILKTTTNVSIGTIASITSDTALSLSGNAASTNTNISFRAQYTQTQGGSLSIKTRTEGIAANGFLVNSVLAKGFGVRMRQGILDTNKFFLTFYQGSFCGVNNFEPSFNKATWSSVTTYAANAIVYYDGMLFQSLQSSNTNNSPIAASSTYWKFLSYSDNFSVADAGQVVAKTLLSSPEFLSLTDFINWTMSDGLFNVYFKLDSSSISGSGYVDSADLATLSSYTLASGGTETYNPSDLDDVLAEISDEDNSFFLCDQYGDNAKGTNNTKILSHIVNDSEFEKQMFVGGGYDSSKFTGTNGSLDIASYFNSSKVEIVHSGVAQPKSGGGVKNYCTLYSAAEALGRIAGLEPQTPGTWKDVRMSYPIHELNKRDREKALMGGVIHFKLVNGKGWVINQAINSLQRNENLVLPEGDSYEISIERIKMQLNRELVLNSRVLFVGGNYSTASAIDVKLFTEGYLLSRTVRNGVDNLIVSFRDVKVKLVGDAWEVSYGIVPNGPINKLFYTGTILDANISI